MSISFLNRTKMYLQLFSMRWLLCGWKFLYILRQKIHFFKFVTFYRFIFTSIQIIVIPLDFDIVLFVISSTSTDITTFGMLVHVRTCCFLTVRHLLLLHRQHSFFQASQIFWIEGMMLKGGATGQPGSIKVIHNSVRENFHSVSLSS